jgi:hypothetical protein
MASSINASTAGAGGVITTADNSGVLNLQSGGTTVATINSTGIVMASNTAPAFSVYANSATSCLTSTYTKVAFQVENFDTNNNFDSTTNYRFTPTVAGYYQINAAVASVLTATIIQIALYKNSSIYNIGSQIPSTTNGIQVTLSSLVYMNGSTDYLEIYFLQNSGVTGSTYTANNNQYSYFNGFLARSA